MHQASASVQSTPSQLEKENGPLSNLQSRSTLTRVTPVPAPKLPPVANFRTKRSLLSPKKNSQPIPAVNSTAVRPPSQTIPTQPAKKKKPRHRNLSRKIPDSVRLTNAALAAFNQGTLESKQANNPHVENPRLMPFSRPRTLAEQEAFREGQSSERVRESKMESSDEDRSKVSVDVHLNGQLVKRGGMGSQELSPRRRGAGQILRDYQERGLLSASEPSHRQRSRSPKHLQRRMERSRSPLQATYQREKPHSAQARRERSQSLATAPNNTQLKGKRGKKDKKNLPRRPEGISRELRELIGERQDKKYSTSLDETPETGGLRIVEERPSSERPLSPILRELIDLIGEPQDQRLAAVVKEARERAGMPSPSNTHHGWSYRRESEPRHQPSAHVPEARRQDMLLEVSNTREFEERTGRRASKREREVIEGNIIFQELVWTKFITETEKSQVEQQFLLRVRMIRKEKVIKFIMRTANNGRSIFSVLADEMYRSPEPNEHGAVQYFVTCHGDTMWSGKGQEDETWVFWIEGEPAEEFDMIYQKALKKWC